MQSERLLLGVLAVTLVSLCHVQAGHKHRHHHNTLAEASITLSDVLAPGQKWHNQDRTELITIEKVNTGNATFAATYDIRDSELDIFPIRGEYDPDGVSIGWVVSYWNDKGRNYHSLGAWAGYYQREEEERGAIVTTRLITHNGDPADTTVGFDRYTLEE